MFGLNENAAITSLQNEMLDMFSTVMSLEGAEAGVGAMRRFVFDLCDQYLNTLTPLNEEDVQQVPDGLQRVQNRADAG